MTATSSTAGSVTLTVGADNSSTTLSGAIANGSGTIALAKAGSGTLTLAGANTNTGATTVSAGALKVDGSTGAYNLRFLEDLLEKEISRAGRHHHHLTLVLFHLANHAELLSRLGNKRAELILGQMVELMRSKTRKVNSLARVNETDFCLVIPEAAEDVAEKIADELTTLAQGAEYMTDLNGGKGKIRVTLQTRTVANPPAVDVALQRLAHSPN